MTGDHATQTSHVPSTPHPLLLRRPVLLIISFILTVWNTSAETTPPPRTPADPLTLHNPYFGLWSTADHLTDATTQHWTGQKQELLVLMRVNEKTLRVIHDEDCEIYLNGSPALRESE